MTASKRHSSQGIDVPRCLVMERGSALLSTNAICAGSRAPSPSDAPLGQPFQRKLRQPVSACDAPPSANRLRKGGHSWLGNISIDSKEAWSVCEKMCGHAKTQELPGCSP